MKLRNLVVAFVTATTLFFALIPPVLAQDQPPVSFRNTLLSINPEYDDLMRLGYPSVLVMFEGEIVSGNTSPKLTFLVPSDAEMYSAGSGPRNQYQVGISLNRSASNITGWDEVSFIPSTKYFVVEYYAPIRGETDRFIPFDFRTLYPITDMRAIVQEPRGSTKFKVSPEGSIGIDREGFRVHNYNFANTSPDQPLLFDITYTKKDTTSSNTILILVVMGVIAALVAAFFFIPRARPAATRSQRRQAARAVRKGQAKNRFCRHCGKPVQGTDRFCPYCGQQLD